MKQLAATARSLLFLPCDRLDRLDKALASRAQMVILDLEDAVSADAKPPAREAVQARWSQLEETTRQRLAIRINAANTPWHADDCRLIESIASNGLGAVMLAKAESSSQIARMGQVAAGVPLLPLIESAEGLASVDQIARSPGVARLVFGHLDFQVDMGMECGPDERELDAVRLALTLASRRAEIPGPVDGVTVKLGNDTPLELDTQRGRRLGFTGKLCIHPSQVGAVNDMLGPSPAEIDWARRVICAAQTQSSGAFQFEGAMIDAPVLARARRYLDIQAY
jgi:citrate lyase subunit beta / citryl-CoA lyase